MRIIGLVARLGASIVCKLSAVDRETPAVDFGLGWYENYWFIMRDYWLGAVGGL